MRAAINKIKSLKVDRRGILIESIIFIVIYVILLVIIPAGTPARAFTENIAVLTSSVTAALLIFISLPGLKSSMRPAWLMLAFALLTWALSDLIRTFYLLLGNIAPFLRYIPDAINGVAYLFAAIGLLRYPSESRYTPTRFRYILDALISSGVIATLGWMILVRPVVNAPNSQLSWAIVASYPIADVILLMLLFSVSLSSLMPRLTGIFLGVGLAAFGLSNYAYSSLTPLEPFLHGSFASIVWLIGALIIGTGAVFEKAHQGQPIVSVRTTDTGLSAQFQKVLPVALVLVQFWIVLTNWRLRGNFSNVGVWMSIILGLMLIVRLGIRAGEAELNNYWQLFKNLNDPTIIIDKTGKIIFSNPAYQKLETIAKESGSLFSIFSGISIENLDAVSNKKSVESLEVYVNVKEGKIPYLLSLNPVETESRQTLIAGVAYNLSEQIEQRNAIQAAYDELHSVHNQLEELNVGLERKVAERTATLMDAYRRLEEQNKVLQELDQLKSDFVSMVSHELRNPLNNLGGGMELLQNKSKIGGGYKKTLALMQTEVQRLTRFVESILDVSAIEAGRLELQPTPLSLGPIFEQLSQSWVNSEEAERIEMKIQSDLPDVIAAQGGLESVLRHLIDNAIKYAPDGPVIVSATSQNGQVRIEVRDFGPGIPDDKQKLLFGRFQRLDAKDSQSIYGYGLGLYLSRRILGEMGSILTFDSPEDGGARFSFLLKAAES